LNSLKNEVEEVEERLNSEQLLRESCAKVKRCLGSVRKNVKGGAMSRPTREDRGRVDSTRLNLIRFDPIRFDPIRFEWIGTYWETKLKKLR
jgi:hypothetical protein